MLENLQTEACFLRQVITYNFRTSTHFDTFYRQIRSEKEQDVDLPNLQGLSDTRFESVITEDRRVGTGELEIKKYI